MVDQTGSMCLYIHELVGSPRRYTPRVLCETAHYANPNDSRKAAKIRLIRRRYASILGCLATASC